MKIELNISAHPYNSQNLPAFAHTQTSLWGIQNLSNDVRHQHYCSLEPAMFSKRPTNRFYDFPNTIIECNKEYSRRCLEWGNAFPSNFLPLKP